MILCLCQGVSDRVVRLAIAQGASSVEEVGVRCGAGTDCGSCRGAIEDLVDDAGCAGVAACAQTHGRRAEGGHGHGHHPSHASHSAPVSAAVAVAAGP